MKIYSGVIERRGDAELTSIEVPIEVLAGKILALITEATKGALPLLSLGVISNFLKREIELQNGIMEDERRGKQRSLDEDDE